MAPLVISKIGGLNTQPNELEVQPGSLAVAENVEINRDGVVEVARGFEDFSTNLPDFTPAQLIVSGGVAYLHLDNGIWYNSGGTWYRKRGAYGEKSVAPYSAVVLNGLLYYTDLTTIRSLNLSTGEILIVAGRFGATGDTDGTGDAARFTDIRGICTNGTDLYATDYTRHVIRKITTAGVVTTFAGTAGSSGVTNAAGAAARFNSPLGICSDVTNLYVCDYTNAKLRKVVISTATPSDLGTPMSFPPRCTFSGSTLYVTNISGGTSYVYSVDTSTGLRTTVATLTGTIDGMAVVGAYMYVCINSKIQKVAISDGSATDFVGGSSGFVDGIGTASRMNTPREAVASGDTIFVCDTGNYAIRKLYVSQAYLTTTSGVSGAIAAATGPRIAGGILVGPT